MASDKDQDLEDESSNWRYRIIPGWVWRPEHQEKHPRADRPKARENISICVQRQERLRSQFKGSQAGEILSCSVRVSFLFHSGSSWLDVVHLQVGGPSALFSLRVRMLTSSKNILTETPKIIDQISGYPVAHSSWHINLPLHLSKKRTKEEV